MFKIAFGIILAVILFPFVLAFGSTIITLACVLLSELNIWFIALAVLPFLLVSETK